MGVISVVAVVAWTVPPFLFVAIPLLLIYKQIQSYYLATSRELKRIDATTKSPIFAMFGETLNGLVTIRAFGHQVICFLYLFSDLSLFVFKACVNHP